MALNIFSKNCLFNRQDHTSSKLNLCLSLFSLIPLFYQTKLVFHLHKPFQQLILIHSSPHLLPHIPPLHSTPFYPFPPTGDQSSERRGHQHSAHQPKHCHRADLQRHGWQHVLPAPHPPLRCWGGYCLFWDVVLKGIQLQFLMKYIFCKIS